MHLNYYARVAILVFVVFPLPIGVSDGKSKADVHKKFDTRSVWKPSQEAMRALKEATSNGKGTQQTLLEVMKNDRASNESLSFAASFSSEAAYLSAVEPPHYFDGFTVGEVIYPFRKAGARTFVILNVKLRIIDVSDPKFVNHIDIASSKDFKNFWDSALRAECVWSEPQEYDIGPGAHDHTNVEVSFPIRDHTKADIIGKAYVVFEFSYPGRKLVGTWLDYVEKKGK